MEKTQILGKLQLAIEPHSEGGDVLYYKIYLINTCNRALHFNYDFKQKGLSQFKMGRTIGKDAPFFLNSFELDQLNEQLSVDLDFVDRKTGELLLTKSIGIKAKDIFRDAKPLPWELNEGFLILIHNFKESPVEPKVNLQELDLEKLRNSMLGGASKKDTTGKATITDSARVLDLHAEAFLSNFEHMNNGEILKLQLDRFHQALDQAIQDGIPKLIVIHGVGKGKLREAIYKLIPEYPQVKSYENSHDHRFGFGATEILLGD